MNARTAPVSSAQARLWLLDRMFPGEPLYNELFALRIEGALDATVLARALNDIVRRHDSLRTRFEVEAGAPVQRVAAALEIALPLDDLSAIADDRRDDAARGRAREDARMPFDLERGPLLRARLLRLGAREHWLVVVVHHIVTDGWSSVVMLREIALGYAALATAASPPYAPLALQYADFATQQRDALGGEATRASLDYWRRALDGVATLDLPTDRPRPPVPDHAGARFAFAVDAELARAIKALSRRLRTTPFMTLVAAFDVLLHRFGSGDDVAVGVPVAARQRPELEPLIGLFVNMIVLRADLGGAPRFTELLDRVRAHALDAFEHQGLPFEVVVAALAPPRDASRNPLFQATFALHPASSVDRFEAGGATFTQVGDVVHVTAKFDLTVTLTDGVDGFRGTIDYATALFDSTSVEALARAYVALLRAIVADPEARIDALPMQFADERDARIARGDATRALPAQRVEALFVRRAAAAPDAVAIRSARGDTGYRELDARANRLAHAIAAAGSPRRVGIALERGVDLVVAMLGTLKAGAAYVPLDPEHPAERLRALCDDAGVGAIVTEAKWLDGLPAIGANVLAVDRDAVRIAAFPDTPPEVRDADDIACVMSTSGSTGRPKAVPVPHAAIVNLVVDNDYAPVAPDDVVAHLAHPAFDAVTFEVWGALANGAALVPIDKATALEPRALATKLGASGVTTIFLTTALFNAVAREAPGAFAQCRHVLFGGESVEPRWVRDVLRAGAPARLVHVYGPTETTTFATFHVVDDGDAARPTIPIGGPIAGAEVYVLDGNGEPCAEGVPGEIHVGGAGLARGYLGNDALTAERFVRHPFAREPVARLYRTGDRGRYRADGAIEFLGRVDRQVKVRGHRIELDEVEAALRALPSVRDAVVALRGDTSDTRRLVAWLVPSDPRAPPPTTLRRDLRARLPESMLPAATVWIPSLPLTATGKVDVRALPEPGEAMRSGVPTPPRDMFEGVLVRIWEQVLGVRGLGVHDRFFEIGGHSLLAAKLVDAIERETGYRVPLTALFADDTVDGLARTLREGAPDADSPVVVVNARGQRPPFVFLHGDFQAGGFYSRALALALGPDQPTLIVHPHGLAGDAVPATIEAMATDRILAVRRFRPEGPYAIGGHCNGALVAFEMARQLVAAGDEVLAVVLIESRAPGPVAEPADAAGAYVKFNQRGEPTLLAPRDRLSEIELLYTRAIDAYAGGRLDAHAIVIQAQEWSTPSRDAGWARLAASWEGHVVSGGHVTMITRHLDELARTVRDAIGRRAVQPQGRV